MMLRRLVALGAALFAAGCAAILGIDEGAVADGVRTGELTSAMRERLRGGLVGYWQFEGSGRTSLDGGADLVASKPTPAMFDAGIAGAGWIPGLATDDGCSNCSRLEQDAARPELAIQRDFTISIWVKPESTSATARWFEHAILDNDQIRIFGEAFNVDPAPCRPAVFIMKNRTPVYVVRDPVFDFRSASNRGRWAHIVAFRRDVTLGIRVNGVTTTTTQAAPAGEGAAGTFRIGGTGADDAWQGALDELGIWNRALESDELDALYNDGRGGALFP